MTLTELTKLRLLNQQIAEPQFKKPEQLVEWMGAMQAQDYAMVKWAVGLRLIDATETSVEKAIDDGKIIRIHLMRPTWHLVAAKDVRWMLELTAPQLTKSLVFRNSQLELDSKVLSKSNSIIAKLLEGDNHLTREEIMEELNKAGINTEGQRAVHILLNAELESLICSGKRSGKDSTYALLDERVPKEKKLLKEEAWAELVKRYFTSHGPATMQDFTWWAGCSVANAKAGLETIKSELNAKKIGEQTYYWMPGSKTSDKKLNTTFLLPAFDEYLISYKDRSAVIEKGHTPKALSSNGIFYPIIVVNGKAIGTWKRVIKKDKVTISLSPFTTINKAALKEINAATQEYAKFIGKSI